MKGRHLLEQLPEDPILGISKSFAQDPRKEKVNLGVGAYRDANGQPFVFRCIEEGEKELATKRLPKEYLPIEGDKEYIEEALALIYGEDARKNPHFLGAQTIGATGALRIGGEFLRRLGVERIHLPQITWPNHHFIFQAANLSIHQYPFFDPFAKEFHFSKLVKYLENLGPKDACLFQAAGHNPTGMDFSNDEWKKLAEVFKKTSALSFFDSSYQGVVDGLKEDVSSIGLFAQQKIPHLVASSFSKNLGLYGERAGLLALYVSDINQSPIFFSHICRIIRGAYSSPPLHSARLVKDVLIHKKASWIEELNGMRMRQCSMREALAKNIDRPVILKQKGMFCLFGLTQDQVMKLREKFAIYLPLDGRINVAGLHEGNLSYVSQAILQVIG